MIRKILKIILTFNIVPLFACAGGYWGPEYTCLFDPNLIISDQSFRHTYYHSWIHEASWLENKKDLNIKDWQTFLGEEYSYELLDNILYKTSWYELREVLGESFDYETYKSYILSQRKGNTWTAKDKAFLEYLELAYIAQAQSYDKRKKEEWNYPPDYAENTYGYTAESFFNRLKEQIKKETFPFLKDRYVFQGIKVMRYQGLYDLAIEMYSDYFSNKQSFIKSWAQDHVAGIYRLQGHNTLANYYFVQVFTDAPANRHSAYHGVSIRSQEDWDSVYEKLNNQEKISLHFIRATHSDSKALYDIQAIYQLDPNHEFVDLLVTREINKMESILLSGEDENTYNKAEVQTYMQQLLKFNNGRIATTSTFTKIILENRYLSFLLEDYETAYEIRNLSFSEPFLEKQKTIIQLISFIHLYDVNTKENQNTIGELLLKINKKEGTFYDFEHYEHKESDYYREGEFFNTPNHYVFSYLKDHLQNPALGSMFSGETLYSLISYYDKDLNVEKVDALIDYVKNGEETRLKKYILTHYFDTSFVFSKTNQDYINALLDIKATLLLRNPETLNEAIAIFEKLSEDFYNKNEYYKITDNPFNAYLDDCIGTYKKCKNHKTTTQHTKLSFAKTLKTIYDKAINENSAMDYFLLGNAYVNMTGYGSSWMATSYYRTSDVTNYMDYSKAQTFYKKALQYTRDHELEAKIHFMLAKCEQWDYWVHDSEEELRVQDYRKYYESLMRHIQKEGYRSHFEIIRTQYSDTKLYQEAIKECKYFDYYVKNL